MDWKRGAIIGRGSYATVSLATTAAGDIFAVKSAELSRSAFLAREKHFLSQLSSPFVIKYMGFDVSQDSYNLFMEYAPGGAISDAVKKRGGSLEEPLIRSYTKQILQGLDYLHLNRLVHCDIKGQNILVGKDGGIKIGDLGCAKVCSGGGCDESSAFSGTPAFMAPEVARGEEQGFPADVWALGCTVIQMATGSNPWPELDDPVSALYRIGYSGDLPEFPRWLSEEAKDFLGKCLKIDAAERWTAKQLLRHPFLDDHDSEEVKESTRNSPTSNLDHGFWDSLDGSEPSLGPTPIGSFFHSPMERITQLIGCTTPTAAPTCLPNWGDEEDWITIRRGPINHQVPEQNGDIDTDDIIELTRVESLFFQNFILQDLEHDNNLIRNDDFLLECPVIEGANSSDRFGRNSLISRNIVLTSKNPDFDDKINGNHSSFQSNSRFFAHCVCLVHVLWYTLDEFIEW